jgi:sarcosine oxidase
VTVPHTADVIVIGLGAVGSAALYQLARRGARVTGIDRFAPPHDRGSSHGESRITRQAIGEGEELVPFALRSHEIWRELEAETGRSLLAEVGGLILGREAGATIHGRPDFVGRTIAAARRFGIPHEVLTPDDVARRFPPFQLSGDETCYYEPGAGFLHAERCVAALLEQARARGASVRTGETVVRVTGDAASVTVETSIATYSAAHAIITAGAWTRELAGGPFTTLLRVIPQTLFWFAASDDEAFAAGRFPIFIWHHGSGPDDHFYGFPVVDKDVKLATEQFAETIEPNDVRPTPTADDARAMHTRHVRGRLEGVSNRVVRATTCLYTVTPDSGFLIDRHPDSERVLVASPCSGHGFKHSAAVGEALAELALGGTSRLDLAPFSLRRFDAHGVEKPRSAGSSASA